MVTNIHADVTVQELVNSLRQSDETIQHLTTLLVKSDNRFRTLERIVRWLGVIFICLTMMVAYVGFDLVNHVQATDNDSSSQPTASPKNLPLLINFDDKMKTQLQQAIGEMLQFFGKLNNLVGNMDSLTNYLSPEQKPGQTNLTQVIQNSGVLTSAQQDELQRVVDSGGGAITYLMAEAAKGLGRIDNMERLVVNMASDMHEMNINMHEMNIKMGIMSYDVDSTMGRMGRWMPW